MNYVHIGVLRYAAMKIQAQEDAARDPELADMVAFHCDHQNPGSEVIDCWNKPEYLVPDATRVFAGGDIERKPMFFCREHTAELIGEEPKAQPIFGRIPAPE